MPLQKLNRMGARIAGMAVVTSALLAGTLLATSAANGEGSEPDRARSSEFEPQEVISALSSIEAPDSGKSRAFSRGMGAEIRSLPDYVNLSDHGTGGIDLASLVFMGSDDSAEYWIGTDSASEICVLTILYSQEVFATACNTADAVEAGGLWLGTFDSPTEEGHRDVTAVLLPDSATSKTGVSVSHELSDDWQQISRNLLVAETDGIEGQEEIVFNRTEDSPGGVIVFER